MQREVQRSESTVTCTECSEECSEKSPYPPLSALLTALKAKQLYSRCAPPHCSVLLILATQQSVLLHALLAAFCANALEGEGLSTVTGQLLAIRNPSEGQRHEY